MQLVIANTNGTCREYASAPGHAACETVFTIPYREVAAESGSLEICLDFLSAAAGDEGYYTVPHTNGCFLTCFTPREDVTFTSTTNVLQMTGGMVNDTAWLVAFEGMKYEAQPRVKVENGRYTLSVFYDLDTVTLWEDIVLRVVHHGYVLSNPSAETVNYMIKSPQTRLKFYEYGGVPALDMVHFTGEG